MNAKTTGTPSGLGLGLASSTSASRLPRATGSTSTSSSTSSGTPRSSTPTQFTRPSPSPSFSASMPSNSNSNNNNSNSNNSNSKNGYPYSSSTTTSLSKHSRSRSNLNLASIPPKVLPFPDLSTIRSSYSYSYSRDSSRAGSPLSTPPIVPGGGVTFDQMIMMRTNSESPIPHQSSRNTSPTPTSGGVGGGGAGLASSTSPPVPSPLAANIRHSTSSSPSTNDGQGERGRASTAPSVAVQTPSPVPTPPTRYPPVLASIVTSASPSTPNRAHGFRPASPMVNRTTTQGQQIANTPLTRPNANANSIHSPSIKSHFPPSMTIPVFLPPPSQHLTDHLYQSFLKGTCADIRLVIRKWGVCYHVHRMILSQATFFHSLFLGGFSENTPGLRRSRKGKERAKSDIVTDEEWLGEDVELRFDDPNITRAAFEICLSRLYSSYPHLHFPVVLLPTAARPLTSAFLSTSSPNLQQLQTSLPADAHLATPRLLLSLLATTIYLGHGALMREALALILRTVGPMTVHRYLAFAVGDGIGDEEWRGQTSEGAKQLDGVAKVVHGTHTGFSAHHADEDEEMVEQVLRAAQHTPRLSTDSDTKIRDDDSKVGETSDVFGASQIPTLRFPSRSSSMRSADIDPFLLASADALLMPHFYGIVGNKIGEACACWLARWGVGLLQAEIESESSSSSNLDAECKIWSHRGLPAKFVRALLSSDYLFVRDEMERYRVARKVLNLRRKGWEVEMEGNGDLSLVSTTESDHGEQGWDEWEEEEAELQKVFAEGIHYCHMTFEDLSTIAADIDPSTSLPYAPLAVLQAAHWTAADLRARVTAHERDRAASPPLALTDDENELGLTQTTSSITSSISKRRRPTPRSRVPSPAVPTFGSTSPSPANSTFDSSSIATRSSSTGAQVYHPVPTDETHRIGASGLTASHSLSTTIPDFGPDLQGLGDNTSDISIVAGGKKVKPPPHGEKNFFGLQGGKMTSSEIEEKWMSEGGAFAMSQMNLGVGPGPIENAGAGVGGKKEERWSKIEPFRFSVEFWDVDKLGEKERFYSTTHFYAGSFFNCYVQMIKRKEKGVQLGIYLHRQSPNEPFPTPSAPTATARNTEHTSSENTTTTGITALSVPTANSLPFNRTITNTNHSTQVGGGGGGVVGPGSPPVISSSLGSTPPASGNVSGGGGGGGVQVNEVPYQDTRSVTKAYFSISCASALGTALIRFTSGPDSFAHSQSWGWKSSALKSDEYLSPPLQIGFGNIHEADEDDDDDEEHHGVLGWKGEIPILQNSLRATVVVGVV